MAVQQYFLLMLSTLLSLKCAKKQDACAKLATASAWSYHLSTPRFRVRFLLTT